MYSLYQSVSNFIPFSHTNGTISLFLPKTQRRLDILNLFCQRRSADSIFKVYFIQDAAQIRCFKPFLPKTQRRLGILKFFFPIFSETHTTNK